jgi:hypothetical protein
MSKFFEIPPESFSRRSNSMSNETFKSIRRLQESGAPLPLIVSNPAWQTLLERIDSNITERSIVLQDAISKLPIVKRALVTDSLGALQSATTKRQRVDDSLVDVAATAHEGDGDSYEAYRKQCWTQYYDWLDQQKSGKHKPDRTGDSDRKSEKSDRDEDEDIHNALLGLS